ncbi:glycosyltransferase family 4 protein [Streptomyces johnsoniae]|uniref:Glycosyltransferase family 4 protein n=1 Tax=Streptomyces johnsoniae TaxID=3075532 RepID=A0ABU2RX87_9ACTN|nr:glycosyltransferase family 4 protein [Streptomyces sp. DSM 41886]MDT0441368.1 glycosyltransferase family 4 protein [Streptomyces sp. DSM 41886]
MNIAFVMLTYHSDEPAGIERSLASLAAGLRELGHHTLIIAADSADHVPDPHVVRLSSVSFPRPVPYEEIPRLLAGADAIGREVRRILADHRTDVVCWGDAVSGLGFLSPAGPGTRTALMVHFPRADEAMRQSLANKPDAVITVSPFMIEEAARAGLDSRAWHALPNALLVEGRAPSGARREELRRTGPVRVVARADPQKGVADLLRSLPPGLGRTVQVVLAKAGFELLPALQDRYLRECAELADTLDTVEILPPLPWGGVQEFLAGAAVALVPSTGPESFGNVAAEALSVGTPVVGFRMGHLPALVGAGGRAVEFSAPGDDLPALRGPAVHIPSVARRMNALWSAAVELLGDESGYHEASRQALLRTTAYTPSGVAKEFLKILGL